jgi:hypothetical protein
MCFYCCTSLLLGNARTVHYKSMLVNVVEGLTFTNVVEGLTFTKIQLSKECFYGVCPRIVYGGNVTGPGLFV